ncbi:uncharacterized protein LOC108231913 isoform X2 [Kryptolebias marmoratus]|uniref:uncharacterized protein LOC108231913 isoform X2 n=1 Tax=Kryptolebias marmoratus TaxID=37003 RepID=UPI000D530881|nr:uncharacterized protein LOC108231913 isoform X2 [Kryptolebias marmoratus]
MTNRSTRAETPGAATARHGRKHPAPRRHDTGVSSVRSGAGGASEMTARRCVRALLLLLCAALAPPRVDGIQTTCRMVTPGDLTGEQCRITLSTVQTKRSPEGYSECIGVLVWIKAGDFSSNWSRRIEVELLSDNQIILRPAWRGQSNTPQLSYSEKVKCKGSRKHPYALVERACFYADAKQNVSVSYGTNCARFYRVPDPRPDFSLSVDRMSKTVLVSVDEEEEVNVRICFQQGRLCEGSKPSAVYKSAVLKIPHMLPCTCIEMYYNYRDARRNVKCPFQNETILDVSDVLDTSEVEPYESHIEWSYKCPASGLNVSASLCWKQHKHVCIPVLNSTLDKKDGNSLEFNLLNVDKHPQMCVQFSIQGHSRVSCLFKDEQISWQTSIEAGRQSISVLLTSAVPAKFSAQLCVLTEGGCAPRGALHSGTTTENAAHRRINVPVQTVTENLCVQVWQSDPALTGRRILCLDYTHNRWGLYAAAVLILAVLATLFGFFLHRSTKSGAGGLLMIQKPLLLVCSSDQSSQISAVCALASILQGELGATVHTALWQQNSQRQAESGAGVADLGPIPWLYGQWEAVCEAQGKVLLFWSADAKRSYDRWKGQRAGVGCERIGEAAAEDSKANGKWKKEKPSETAEMFEEKDWRSQKEPSTVIEPVFTAALASLEGALQEGKGKDVAIVYFQGLCHSRDIPRAFRGVPRYCLPWDFSDLMQELAEVRAGTKSGEFRRSCGHRLLSKVMSMWLARQLARRLQTVLPQTQGHEAHSVPPASDRARSRPAAPRSEQEQELL